jgi:phosphoribosylformylglycinamidine synthase
MPVCEVPGRALTDDAPAYVISGRPPALPVDDLEPLAVERPTVETLLDLLGSPGCRDRRPIWRRYDHMNGTNTVVGPGAGDAAVLRVKGTRRALALAIDGPGPTRIGALDPYVAGASAVIEGALNVGCMGATPIGVTDCLNFGSPETDLGAWQLERAIDGIADACRALGVPIVSGNVSLYNETPDGPILPTPVVGTVGLIEDRAMTTSLRWSAGDELWILGEPADDVDALAASELAWRRARRGGRASLDVAAASRLVRLLPSLIRDGAITSAHDVSVGGIGVALARMAMAAGVGASIEVAGGLPTAALFGERGGRVIVGVPSARAAALAVAMRASGVAGVRLGTAGGEALSFRWSDGAASVPLDRLGAAWGRPF